MSGGHGRTREGHRPNWIGKREGVNKRFILTSIIKIVCRETGLLKGGWMLIWLPNQNVFAFESPSTKSTEGLSATEIESIEFGRWDPIAAGPGATLTALRILFTMADNANSKIFQFYAKRFI